MRYSLVFAFILNSISAFAQLREFSISEMPRPEVAVVQANSQFPDDALVLVYSVIDGLEFRSSLGAIDKQSYNASASRYELLMRPVKQMLFATKAGFIEAKIATFNPSPKDVYYFKVETQRLDEQSTVKPGTLQLRSDPPSAEIYLNGVKIAEKTPFEGMVNPGSTRIQLKKKTFEEFDTTVFIRNESANVLHIELKPTTLWLNVNSSPSGASVFLGNRELGTTQLSKEFDLGEITQRGRRTLTIRKENYRIFTQEIDVQPAKKPMEIKVQLEHELGAFSINSMPAGAEVYIDGSFKGSTPLNGQIEIGQHDVMLTLDGYSAVKGAKILVNSADTIRRQFVLQEVGGETQTEFDIETISIGSQIWMAENLNTTHFRNGEAIPEIKDAAAWLQAGEKQQAAWCYYENDASSATPYGKLYNWYAVSDPRGLCPVGWKIPSDTVWRDLSSYLGDELAGNKMKSNTGWSKGENGSNSSGINAYPAGIRGFYSAEFYSKGEQSTWWSSKPYSANGVWIFSVNNSGKNLALGSGNKKSGFSVRCIKE